MPPAHRILDAVYLPTEHRPRPRIVMDIARLAMRVLCPAPAVDKRQHRPLGRFDRGLQLLHLLGGILELFERHLVNEREWYLGDLDEFFQDAQHQLLDRGLELGGNLLVSLLARFGAIAEHLLEDVEQAFGLDAGAVEGCLDGFEVRVVALVVGVDLVLVVEAGLDAAQHLLGNGECLRDAGECRGEVVGFLDADSLALELFDGVDARNV